MFRVTVDDDVDARRAMSSTDHLRGSSHHYAVVTATDLPSYRRRHASSAESPANRTNHPDDAVTPEARANDDGIVTFRRMRRYTDFKRLHDALTREGGAHEARLPSMPKKALVNTVAVVTRRRETFRYVLDAVARDYVLRECEEVIDFLTRADGGEVGGDVGGWANGNGNANADAARGEDEDEDEDDKGKRRDEISREEEEEEEAPLPPRDGRGLESLLASTMRVHGSKTTVVPSVDACRDDDGANDDDVFDETEMTTTTATATATPVPAPSSSMSSMAMSSLGASTTTTYENTNAGAREAVKANDAAALDAILRSGLVDVNGKDSSGMTLLHLACLFNRATAVETLLELGADPELRNAQGETAMDVAPPTTRVRVERTLKNRKK